MDDPAQVERSGERSSLLPRSSQRNGVAPRYSSHTASYNVDSTSIPLPSSTVIEPPNQKRSRWRSIRIMYFTMFLSAVTFTMSMSTLWPYLQVVDQSAQPSFLGWVVAAYSVGQLVASPLFGSWSARRQAREPLLVSLFLQLGANLFYAFVQSVHGNGGDFLLLARVLMGFASGNVGVVRAYVSGATTLEERTGAMTFVSLWQTVGFILGPVLQTALVTLNYPGPVEKPWLHFNMYTAPAFLATALSLVNLLLLITVFQLHAVLDGGAVNTTLNVADDVEEESEVRSEKDTGRPDLMAVFVTMFLFFAVFFVFTLFETIMTPLVMDMYGWTKRVAALYTGLIMGVAGIISVGVFVVIKILTKRGADERKLLIAGFSFCLLGFVTYLPWGSKPPVIGFAPLYTPVTIRTTIAPTHDNSTPAYLPWFDKPADAKAHDQGRALRAPFVRDASLDPGRGSQTTVAYTNQQHVLLHRLLNNNTEGSTHTAGPFISTPTSDTDVTAAATVPNGGSQPAHLGPAHTHTGPNGGRQPAHLGPANTATGTHAPSTTPTADTGPNGGRQPAHLGPAHTHTGPNGGRQPAHLGPANTATGTHAPSTTPTADTGPNGGRQPAHLGPAHTHTGPNGGRQPAHLGPANTATGTHAPSTTPTADTGPNGGRQPAHLGPAHTHTGTHLDSTTPNATGTTNSTQGPNGCPWEFSWCHSVPRVRLFQFLLGSALVAVGYPICNVMTYTLFSKVLGPQPQGLWMGLLTASGSLARTVGPIFVAQLYDAWGPRVTFAAACGALVVTIAVAAAIYRRLLPFHTSPYRTRHAP